MHVDVLSRRSFLASAGHVDWRHKVCPRCRHALSARLCGQQAGAHRGPRDQAIEESFRIAVRLTEDMRRLAYRCYKRDGWLAVSDGKNGPQHSYDPRDFHFGPKCRPTSGATTPAFAREMGRRIFQDQSDPADGRLRWDSRNQCSIHLAQPAKHFSDYMVYAGQDALVRDNWERMVKTLKWGLARYDPEQKGLIEQGPGVSDHFWALLVGEPYNFAEVENCSRDVAVVSSMEVYEWLKLAGEYAAGRNLVRSSLAQGPCRSGRTTPSRRPPGTPMPATTTCSIAGPSSGGSTASCGSTRRAASWTSPPTMPHC